MSRMISAPEQLEATRPDRSNWVGANAGSGKTHVLTQRVARLLLAGAAPQKILCLTYTKAAAAEMQTRLFRLLGDWAMAPEAELALRLSEVSGSSAPPDPAQMAEARRLFARALETPGGLKIQTIHAFCDSLLRRFPLEAGISPNFEVADDRQSMTALAGLRVDMALAAEAGTDDAFDRAAQRLNEGGLDDLAEGIMSRRTPFRAGGTEDVLAAHFGQAATATRIEIAKEAMAALDPRGLAPLAEVLIRVGGKREKDIAALLEQWFAAIGAEPLDIAAGLTGQLLTKSGAPPKSGLATKKVQDVRPQSVDDFRRLTDWAMDTREKLLAEGIVRQTRDLYSFAGSLLARQDRLKNARGFLDFDDLIARTHALLTDRAMRGWVLYKLDQGIDHILVDEAQDTSPQQWEVIAAIAEEFLAGQGARPEARSLFVVGDEKQSIYSFQGAQPQAFGQMRDHFAQRLEALGTPLGRPELKTSYRSAPAILEFVDKVFAGEAARGLTLGPDAIEHRAHRQDDQGRVDLWPLVEAEAPSEAPPWWEPVDAAPAADPKAILAEAVAEHIAGLAASECLPARGGKPGCRVRPRDVLVLVARRDRLASGIIQGLKARGVPVAGADRLLLTAELAVKDLLALARFATMPGDDLSLAAVLRSPLCGVSEEDLFTLAHGRPGRLWDAVRNSDAHGEVAAFLDDMAAQADFLRPFEFLEHALVRHDGRRRMLARLGPEAEDALDELLAQALAYEVREVPSLAGFIAWIEAGDIKVKREMDRGTDAVRVMTVHGAKGLEAPIVILPDTISSGSPGQGRPRLLTVEPEGNQPELTIWAPAKSEGRDDAITRRAQEQSDARADAEGRRLLYVAMTRAEDWLIVCGALPRNRKRENIQDTWYGLAEAGMTRCETEVTSSPSPTGVGDRLRFETGAPPDGQSSAEPVNESSPVSGRPDWLGPAAVETRVERGRPSGAGSENDRQGGIGLGRDLAMRRGSAVHLVLERLGSEPEGPEKLGPGLLLNDFPDLSPEMRADVLAEARRVLSMPEAGEIFGSETLSEVTVAIDPPRGGPRMIGRVDRLVMSPGRVQIVDIKTDAIPPRSAAEVAQPYLAQLGAYAAGLAPAWPDREISTVLLWTAGPFLMPIPLEKALEAYSRANFTRNTRS